MMKRYCVWGVDKSYRHLWQASLVAGLIALKQRWSQDNQKTHKH